MQKMKGIILLGLLAFSLGSCSSEPIHKVPDVVNPDEGTTPDGGETTPEGGETTPEEGETTPGGQDLFPEIKPGEFDTYKADDMTMTYQELTEADLYSGSLPCKGKSNVVVVPVNFSDLKHKFTFSSSNTNYLEVAFNGKGNDRRTDYWESVSGFYKKTSYGKLDLNFIISDPYTPTFSAREFVNREKTQEGLGTLSLCEETYHNLKLNNKPINFKDPKFDSNNDGYVDAVWFVYNEKDSRYAENYWPYVYWYSPSDEAHNDIKFSAYGNMSVSFLFEKSFFGDDAHTPIHETGHLLGLDDYYTYDVSRRGEQIPSASGSLDMMDRNIGDHSAFSKASLGWLDLRVPTKPGKFTLKPLSESNEAIVLANPTTFNGSAFDEYLILDYYKPNELNKLDADEVYANIKMFTEPGLRINHIDARIGSLKIVSYDEFYFNGYVDLKNEPLTPSLDGETYVVVHSNTRSRNFNNARDEDLIALIPKDNKIIYGKRFNPDNNALFKTGDSFDVSKYSKFFKNQKFNSGNPINWKVKVLGINDGEITLEIDF